MKKRTLRLKPTDYQPSKKELEEEIKIPATPEELAKAILQPTNIVFEPDAK